MTPGDFKHKISIQIRFADIDRLNHVNNACYHNYFELARVKYFNEVLGDAIQWDQQGFVLARTEIDHIAQVHLNDEIECFTRVEKIGTKSVRIRNQLIKITNNGPIIAADCIGILVAMNYKTNESIPVPEAWREAFEAFEKCNL